MRLRFLWRTAVVALCLTSASCSRKSEAPLPVATAHAAAPIKLAPVVRRPPRGSLPAPSAVADRPDVPDVGPRLSFVQGPYGRLRLSDGGQGGVPVVFVHGLGGSYQAWSAQLDALRPARRAAALDLRGHGESDAPSNGDYSVPALADDVETVVSLLGFEKVYLVGHSMAGLVLSSYAGRHPEKVAGMVFVDALGDLQRLSKEEQEAFVAVGTDPKIDLRKLYEDICGQRARPETRARVLEQLDAMKPGAFAALRKTMVEYSPWPDANHYNGPRACIDAEGNDSLVDAWALYQGVPRKRIPNASHWLMMDDPETFNKMLEGFITP